MPPSPPPRKFPPQGPAGSDLPPSTPANKLTPEQREIEALLDEESPDTPGGISDDMLNELAKLNPALEKKVAFIRNIRNQRLQLQAKAISGFTTRDPTLFARKVLGLRPTETARSYGYRHGIAPDSILVLESVRDNVRTAVPAGHGVGKTHTAAIAALHYLFSMDDRIVVTTAPTWTLVEAQLWREIRDQFKKARVPLKGRLLETQLKISERHFAIGLSTDEHSRFQGFHGPNGTLVILDEATGVRPELWDSAESMLTGPNDRILSIGNPTEPSSRFKHACDSGRYNVIRLDSENHPNVRHNNPLIIPGAVTREWVEDRLLEYDTKDSPLYRSRVSGFWPTQSQDTLIPLTLITRAQGFKERQKARQDRSIVRKRGGALGIDISGLGEDLCVASYIEESFIEILWWHRHVELMETVGKLVRTIEDKEGDIRAVAIDDTGIGNGVSSRLLELQSHALRGATIVQPPNSLVSPRISKSSTALALCAIIRVNFGSSSNNKQKFASIKDQMWWQLRESLQHEVRGLPTDADLAKLRFPKGSSMLPQLTSPVYKLESSGQIKVYDKRVNKSEFLKMLPTKSPDIAHSMILAEHAYRTIRAEEIPKTDPNVDYRSQIFHKARHEAMQLQAKKQEHTNYEDDYTYLQD